MADFFYPSFDCGTLDSDGLFVSLPSESFDVYNVTQAASLGTLASDANGVIAEGSFETADPAAAGDIIEFSHSTYPLTARFVLTATQEEAYTLATNDVATYIAENLYAETSDPTVFNIYIQDANGKPEFVGKARQGEVTRIPYQATVPKTVDLYALPEADTQKYSTEDFSTLSSVSLTIPGSGMRPLFDHFTDTPTTGTGKEDLYVDTVVAGTLAQDGDTIKAEYHLYASNNANNKRAFIAFSDPIIDTGTFTTADVYVELEFSVMRVSNTTVRCSSEGLRGSTPVPPVVVEVTSLDLDATDYDLILQGQTSTSAGDITAKMAKVWFLPAVPVEAEVDNLLFLTDNLIFNGDNFIFNP